jgi:hypothetical protein
MRKLLAALIVMAFVFAAVPAMATTAKVPKSICLTFDGMPIAFTLATSKGGKVAVAGETANFYDMHGSCVLQTFFFPIHGSGYVKGNTLDFTITGTFLGPGNVYTFSFQALWDLGTNTGSAAYLLISTSSATANLAALVPFDCTLFSITYDESTESTVPKTLFEGLPEFQLK